MKCSPSTYLHHSGTPALLHYSLRGGGGGGLPYYTIVYGGGGGGGGGGDTYLNYWFLLPKIVPINGTVRLLTFD